MKAKWLLAPASSGASTGAIAATGSPSAVRAKQHETAADSPEAQPPAAIPHMPTRPEKEEL